jgi:ribonucleoside-diphosphate reductase alpha chain
MQALDTLSTSHLSPQPISTDVLLEKYAKGEERQAEDIFLRVARALASVEKEPPLWEARFMAALRAGFIPAGRIMSAAGTGIHATLINCFVQPVGDSVSEVTDGKPGIYEALWEAAETMRRGGGVGYDFSSIRPKGGFVKGTSSSASGPISYMRIFDRSCETVESAGARRGAQMGILRCDHPDILDFIHAKDQPGELSNFNLSVGVTDAFMEALQSNDDWELVHPATPSVERQAQGAYRRDDGLWVYQKINARQLWDEIMSSTYDHAEPGVLFLDRANTDNNLNYCEIFEATNPCAEEWLPPYGCCCLGSIDLTRFVVEPFEASAGFDTESFTTVVTTAVRMLDNVLEVTYWPLEKQRQEAMAKRRIGLGFTGLGNTLVMLGLKYDTDEARAAAAEITQVMRDAAYRTSVELAKEKGGFPLLRAEPYLKSPFTRRLPETIRQTIREHGIRNSHLLCLAPTGTISLAFADNTSSGIEPTYQWVFTRKKRMPDGTIREYSVEDHAYRLFQAAGGNVAQLPSHWVTALKISAVDHMKMLQAVQPFIDSSISKTVNVDAHYPFEDFKDLYWHAWAAGLKGLATYRPNPITGQILTTDLAPPSESKLAIKPDFDESDPDRRLRMEKIPKPPLSSLRWRRRPRPVEGNPAWTYFIDHPLGAFAVFIGHVENDGPLPFEVWVAGVEKPRGLSALAKSLSMDMRSNDHGWLQTKLKSLMKAQGDDGFTIAMPPEGQTSQVSSLVAGFARLVYYRCNELGIFDRIQETPVLDALLSPKEPKTGTDGTLSWTVDVYNAATGDDFVMGLKELILPNGQRRPYSVWLSGVYPKTFDGLCKSLSYDMRVIDPAWAAAKLRQLLDFPEPLGDFLAWVPGQKRKILYPSTIAYLSALILHRYAMLGILDKDGFPIEDMGVIEFADDQTLAKKAQGLVPVVVKSKKRCLECGSYSLIRKDGCDFCTDCGALGACG